MLLFNKIYTPNKTSRTPNMTSYSKQDFSYSKQDFSYSKHDFVLQTRLLVLQTRLRTPNKTSRTPNKISRNLKLFHERKGKFYSCDRNENLSPLNNRINYIIVYCLRHIFNFMHFRSKTTLTMSMDTKTKFS